MTYNQDDNFDGDLQDLDEEYRRAEKKDPESFDEPPDGNYDVVVHSVELKRSQKKTDGTGGNPYFNWQLRIVEPEKHRGRYLFKRNMLTSGPNLDWLKTDLETAGLVLGKISELPDKWGALLDVRLKVRKKTSPNPKNPDSPFVNINFLKFVRKYTESEARALFDRQRETDHPAAGTSDAENTPF